MCCWNCCISLFTGLSARFEPETNAVEIRTVPSSPISDEVELRVQSAFNKLDRTRQMVTVSEELFALRKESKRVSAEQLVNGSVLRSQAQAALAQELEAKALLLQSQLDYVQATDEMRLAIGRTPE
jgi:hypothetical protein